MRPQIVTISLPADRPPWTGTGLQVAPGQQITLLGSGFVRWSPRHDVGAGAKYHLWGRVPGGEIFGCTQDTATVTADRAGELELGIYLGSWADRSGTLATGVEPYRRTSGGLEVVVLVWPVGVDPVVGLLSFAAPGVDPELVAAESQRLRHPFLRPPGWHYLLDFGEADVYRAVRWHDRPAIEVVCDDDAGILQVPCSLPLDPSTRLDWTWRVDAIPSRVAEDSTWTHDYLSIAVELDDGRDISWMWSAALEPDTGTFRCPVRTWSDRETHVPVRSGPDQLGQVLSESRLVWEDYRRFVGEPPPRVVAVWLIAVSHFGRGLGRAMFRDIRLTTGDQTVRVL